MAIKEECGAPPLLLLLLLLFMLAIRLSPVVSPFKAIISFCWLTWCKNMRKRVSNYQ